MVTEPDERLAFVIIGTRDFSYFGPRQFLDKNDIELSIRFEYSVGDD